MEPFLKWPGGKRWLAAARPELFRDIRGRYIEPFLGGGAVYFSLEPNSSVLSDINKDLLGVYSAIRDGWRSIEKKLSAHQNLHCNKHYYQVRASVPTCRFEKAARFVYLNRTCWNGLYRVNLRGEFNVPMGTKSAVLLPSDNFGHVAALLKGAALSCSDFESTVSMAKKGDLVFADPPYVDQEKSGIFKKYHTSLFTWEDQIRLRDALVLARKRGARVVLLNADTPSLQRLYSQDFEVDRIDVRSTIAASSLRRGRRSELIAIA